MDYNERLVKAIKNGVIDRGTAALAIVLHDSDCPRLDGGTCNCNPEYRPRTNSGRVYVHSDGSLSEKP